MAITRRQPHTDTYRLYREREGWRVLRNGRPTGACWGYVFPKQLFETLMRTAIQPVKGESRVRFRDVRVTVYRKD